MPLQKPLIDRIRDAQSIDAECPYVTPEMSRWEAQEVARYWRAAVTACAALHAHAEAHGARLLTGQPVSPPVAGGVSGTGVRLERALELLQTALDHHRHRLAMETRNRVQ